MKKLTILISALIIISSYTMAAQGFACGHKGMKGGHGQKQMQGQMLPGVQFYTRWAEDLKLDDKQIAKINDINTKYQTEIIDLSADMMKKKLAMKNAFNNEDINQSEVEAAVKEMQDARNNIQNAKLKMKFDMRNVLTADQKPLIKVVQDKCRTEFRNKGCGHSGGKKKSCGKGHGHGK